MSDKIVLALTTREVMGKQNNNLRKQGLVPAVVYGRGAGSRVVSVEAKLLERAYREAGGNQIIGVKIDGERLKNVLIHDVQLDSITDAIIHADFYLVRMDEKIKTEIPLHFVGESTAVYQQEGTLVRPLETIEVEALPADLPESIEVDISVLDDFDKSIHVSDLKIPDNVELLTDVEAIVAKVDKPRSDAELEELDEEIKDELPEGAEEVETEQGEDEPATS